MKIIKLTAENIKKLVAVEITPDGNIVQITGKNGQGKSSVLDSIWWALAGASHIQEQPIRKGEKSGRIRLDLGELIVERRITQSGSTLSVETVEGARFPSPQAVLDELLGALSFDPLAFSRMDPKQQSDQLQAVSSIEIDINEMNMLNKGDYAKRTDINREAKEKTAQHNGMVIDDLPEDVIAVDTKSLVQQLQEAGESNASIALKEAAIEKKKAQAQYFYKSAQDLTAKSETLKVEFAKVKAQKEMDIKKAQDLDAELEAAAKPAEPIDTMKLRTDIEMGEATNRSIELRSVKTQAKKALKEEVEKLVASSQEITDRMQGREDAKAQALLSAKMPVEELGFGDGFITYKGVPFDQASSAEQLKVSMAIAMKANPKLRVIRIQDGSLLDDDSLKEIAAAAEKEDYQVWIERVDASGKIGFMMEEGKVHGAPDPAPQEKEKPRKAPKKATAKKAAPDPGELMPTGKDDLMPNDLEVATKKSDDKRNNGQSDLLEEVEI